MTMERTEILEAIRKIVGRKFEFSRAYTKTFGCPTLGNEGRNYSIVTKNFLYIPCRVTVGWNSDETECGVFFHRYSLYSRGFDGENVTKVNLERLFTKDLEKIYKDLLFCLWWEKDVRLKGIQEELSNCQIYAKKFDKLKFSDEDIENLRK